ncbi:hypothetical protein JH028_003519, partial [Acinetobacter baumannii]|nr:hypothetical protein [Acinetobacter baumannii]
MNKLNILIFISLLSSNLIGCQQMQTMTNSTVNTLSKGIQAYDGWVSKGTIRVWETMKDKSIRDKFLV